MSRARLAHEADRSRGHDGPGTPDPLVPLRKGTGERPAPRRRQCPDEWPGGCRPGAPAVSRADPRRPAAHPCAAPLESAARDECLTLKGWRPRRRSDWRARSPRTPPRAFFRTALPQPHRSAPRRRSVPDEMRRDAGRAGRPSCPASASRSTRRTRTAGWLRRPTGRAPRKCARPEVPSLRPIRRA